MKFEALRNRVCEANRTIGSTGLAILTWGNASEADRDAGVMAIKPSGVEYGDLVPESIVVLEIESGDVVEGELRASSDTPSHLHLYRSFLAVGGIVHTHSPYAVAWAQAKRAIPCFGTTHADTFYGPVPCTRELTEEEVNSAYELNTGKVIADFFSDNGLDPIPVPAALVACHGPFTWGKDAASAVQCGIVLEEVARMASISCSLVPDLKPVDAYLMHKHFMRKHGTDAYYGQK